MGNLQSTPSSSTTTAFQKKYDVFLNFRGDDTRDCFTCHLYEALHKKKIETFIDNGLQKGDGIWPTLKGAIEQSKISVVIFSKDYASSKWCLHELVEIMERKKMPNQIVIPVFYRVDPSNVRNQTGSFKDSFDKHGKESQEVLFLLFFCCGLLLFFALFSRAGLWSCLLAVCLALCGGLSLCSNKVPIVQKKKKKESQEEVQKWREALTEASNLSGWDSSVTSHDAELIDQIVEDIWTRLMREYTSYDIEGLIGYERIEHVISLLSLHVRTNVQITGIWGMGGIGKTYIAKAIFEKISNQFEGFCFIENVRERLQKFGVDSLKKEILSEVLDEEHLKLNGPIIPSKIKERLNRTKVLIVLDDVNDEEDYLRLANLALGVDRLGLGSRIIITSRNKHVLRLCGVNKQNIFEVVGFNNHDALQLFCNCAFRENDPPEDFTVLSNELVEHSKGNLLALTVSGLSLYQQSKQAWESVVNTLQTTNLNRHIFNVLRISYDGLEKDSEKNIFLDIACFFKGETQDYVEKIIGGDCCYSLGVLINKSLITISSGRIQMHDLLEEMGREIVDEESPYKPGKRRRLWRPKDVQNTLQRDKGTDAVQGIVLDLSNIKVMQLSSQAFKNMCNLRILKFYDSSISGSESHRYFPKYKKQYGIDFSYNSKVHFPKGLSDLSDELRSLIWIGFPLTELPSNFNPENLLKLDLRYSNLERLWEGAMHAPNLRWLILDGCKRLTNIPDLSDAPLLERIDLKGCQSLLDLPPLAPSLKYLNYLGLEGCVKLRSFPSDIHFESLTSLELCGCDNLTKFPEISADLIRLDLSGTAIDEVPPSIGSLTKLSDLILSNCTRLKHISTNICKLKSLYYLNLANCSGLESFLEIPSDLRYLDLHGTAIDEVPSSIESLTKLSNLILSQCTRLKHISTNICKLKSLSMLDLENCSGLESFPEICETMEGLQTLRLSGTGIKELPGRIEHLNGLIELNLRRCKNLKELPSSICSLTSLQCLDLSDCSKLEMLPDNLGKLKSLKELSIDGTAISQLPSTMMHLNELDLLSCGGYGGLRFTHSSVFLSSLSCLALSDCNLKVIPEDICHLSKLVDLDLSGNDFEGLPKSMKQLSNLENLEVNNCNMLQSLTELPLSIKLLRAIDCEQLRSIPEASELAVKAECTFTNCPNLEETVVGNILATVKGYGRKLDSFSFCCPGSKVPEWFRYKSDESSIKFHDCFNGLLRGFIVCAVIEFEEYCFDATYGNGLFISCKWKCSGSGNQCTTTGDTLIATSRFGKLINSDHVALLYCTAPKSGFTNFSFEFWLSDKRRNCRVKSCGVRPITKIPNEDSDEESDEVSNEESDEVSNEDDKAKYAEPIKIICRANQDIWCHH